MTLIKRFAKYLFKRKVSSRYYEIGQGSIMYPHGIQISFRTTKADRKYVVIGNKCLINCDFIFESIAGMVVIGDNVHIGGATMITRSEIIIGNDVTMAWGIYVYDHNSHSIYWKERKNDNAQCYSDYKKYNGNNLINKDWSNVNSAPIIIEDKVWIGFGVTILKGVRIGEGAVIGAMSVVTKNVPAWSVVAGNPAKVVKSNI
jgi:acetyltransferase-like isoleucine patch superfamily enzyme